MRRRPAVQVTIAGYAGRGLVFAACAEACLPFDELQKLYQAEMPRPIDIELLAHIVSCEAVELEIHEDLFFVIHAKFISLS